MPKPPPKSPCSESQDEEFYDADDGTRQLKEDALIDRLYLYKEDGRVVGNDDATGENYGRPGEKPVPPRALELFAQGYYGGAQCEARARKRAAAERWVAKELYYHGDSSDHVSAGFSSDGD